MGNKTNWLIHKGINLLKFKTNVSIFNLLSNNDDIVFICNNLYLGNINSCQDIDLLKQHNIQSIVNCSKNIPIHDYFKLNNSHRIDIEDSKEMENIENFKSKIIKAVLFIDKEINNDKNVIVHCYWGLMRSPTVIAAYLMYKYNMDVDTSIEWIKDKKNFSFHNLYNFKEILYYVKKEIDSYVRV